MDPFGRFVLKLDDFPLLSKLAGSGELVRFEGDAHSCYLEPRRRGLATIPTRQIPGNASSYREYPRTFLQGRIIVGVLVLFQKKSYINVFVKI